MDIEKQFSFLVNDYGFRYAYQEFSNCFGGNWFVYTHSFYNDTGCFTIHILPQRGELDFYYSQVFSNVRESLCETPLNVEAIEPDIWKKHSHLGPVPKPFFWFSNQNVLRALSEVLAVHIAKQGQLFGIIIK